MSYMQDITARTAQHELFQLSIDGQIWTVDARKDRIVLTNGLGRREEFAESAALLDALQGWFENPAITVL